MPKRKRVSPYLLANKYARGRAGSYYARRTRISRVPMQRLGYGSVARARGAPVTGEMKYFDTELFASAISVVTTTWVAGTNMDPASTINLGAAAVATPLCLFAPTVGAALNQRIGRKVKMMKVKVRGHINVPVQAAQAAADTSTFVRLALVMDKQTNAAQMTGAQLYNDSSNAFATINSYQNPNNFGRFKILKERSMPIRNLNLVGSPTAADVVQDGTCVPFKLSYRFKAPVTVNFNATNGGTVADIIDNSLHIICGAYSIAYAPSLSYYTRVSYKE